MKQKGQIYLGFYKTDFNKKNLQYITEHEEQYNFDVEKNLGDGIVDM